MRIEAWAQASSAEMAPLYEAEHARFLAVLGWETTATWTALERARAAGHVPGLVARDARGAVQGWTFYVRRGGELQVGGFTAVAEACAPLLDGMLSAEAAGPAPALRVFGYTDAAGLPGALAARGFSVGAYDYWTAPLAVAPRPTDVRPWGAGDSLGHRRTAACRLSAA